MSGTPWIAVNGLDHYTPFVRDGMLISDYRDGELYRQLYDHVDTYSAICQLVYFTPEQLGLTEHTTFESILIKAKILKAKPIPYGIAMRVRQHPKAFSVPWHKRLLGYPPRLSHCILGIHPIVEPNGKRWVPEVSGQYFRFKSVDTCGTLHQSPWVFAV
jgi:hypothetical protein